jgi:uncharacterized membrane protein
MHSTTPRWDEERMDRTIGTLLRVGVLVSVFVVLVGGIWCLAQSGETVPDYHTFRSEPRELRTVGGVINTAFRRQPRSLIQFGLLLLIATPVARVAFSVFAFAMQRDRLYVAVTLVVLAVLVASLCGLVYPAR